MEEYNYGADMGSMKIMSENMGCFFDNEVGDGEFKYVVWEEKTANCTLTLFLGR